MKQVLIVGCGITGATVARELADKGYMVTILERRNHIGGNMYDYKDEYGILVHKYGPHTFHTNDKKLFDYINQYSEWIDYKLYCGAQINGITTPTPFNFKTIDQFYDLDDANILKKHMSVEFPQQETVTVVEALNSKDQYIKDYAQFLFDNDYSLYTAKQWGVKPEEIDSSVLKRVPLRLSYTEGYFDDIYQVMPKISYKYFFENLLNHKNIQVILNEDALQYISVDEQMHIVKYRGRMIDFPVVYTGPLDELFKHKYGKLPYRSLKFEWEHKDIDSFQEMAVVAYPQAKGYTRITEYKKLPFQNVKGTTYAKEFSIPYNGDHQAEPYYPVLTKESIMQYNKYLEDSKRIRNLVCCGRLADFKYYNMDQALTRALNVTEMISSLRI